MVPARHAASGGRRGRLVGAVTSDVWTPAVIVDAWLERRFRTVSLGPGAGADRIAFITQIGTSAGQAAAERVAARRRRLACLAH